MNITKELVLEVSALCHEYDKAKNMVTRREVGAKIDMAVDGLSDKQIQQLSRIVGK